MAVPLRDAAEMTTSTFGLVVMPVPPPAMGKVLYATPSASVESATRGRSFAPTDMRAGVVPKPSRSPLVVTMPSLC